MIHLLSLAAALVLTAGLVVLLFVLPLAHGLAAFLPH